MPSPDREKHDEYIQRYLKTGKKHIIGSRRETLAKRKDGTTFPIELSISEVDHLGLFTGIISDVTARKKTEEEQRRVSEFNQKIIGTAQTIILILSPEGDITYFNPYFEEISGWKIEDARGKNWFSTFLPERDRKRISSLFGRSLTSSVRTRGNVNPILTKDGRERFVEWYDAVIYDNEGNIAGLLCTGVDVTRSRKLEQEVVKAAEEERSNTAQDLHDGLGSLLTGIDYRMKALGNRCSGIDPALEKEVVEISNLIRSAISQTRGIAKGLHPTGSGPEDLMDSLQTLTSTARMNSDSTIRFHCPEPVLITDPGSSNHLYRIAQEAFNNAIKHSQATYITISLVKKNGRAVLKVMDDGKGFDFSGPESGNLGLKTMHYRARTIGASLTINRRRKSGTEVICSMPI